MTDKICASVIYLVLLCTSIAGTVIMITIAENTFLGVISCIVISGLLTALIGVSVGLMIISISKYKEKAKCKLL